MQSTIHDTRYRDVHVIKNVPYSPRKYSTQPLEKYLLPNEYINLHFSTARSISLAALTYHCIRPPLPALPPSFPSGQIHKLPSWLYGDL